MRITINPTFSWETLERVSHDGQFEYEGSVLLLKGGTEQAQANINTANGLEGTYANDANSAQNEILPFLNQEITNPQGFGQQGVNELLTSGGQATSGAVGAGNEAAQLRASRLGNPSATSGIIDSIARSGMKQQSNNALGINEANLKEKMAQQQEGEKGIASLGNTDLSAALSALGLSNSAVSDYTKAYQATNPLTEIGSLLGDVGQLGSGFGAALGALKK